MFSIALVIGPNTRLIFSSPRLRFQDKTNSEITRYHVALARRRLERSKARGNLRKFLDMSHTSFHVQRQLRIHGVEMLLLLPT